MGSGGIVVGSARRVPAVQPESGATMTATAELGSYINDHLGGAKAGLAMAQRLEQDLRGEPPAETLGSLSGEIRDDLRALRAIARQMGVTENPIKQAIGSVGEKLHRLGLTALAPGNSDLRRLRAVESLSLGVEGKLALWTALIAVAPDHPQLDLVDLHRLADRARDQRRRVEEVRHGVAREAFGVGP
jgi:hypothetical protein